MKAALLLIVAILLPAMGTEAAVVRSQAAKNAFARQHACPSTGLHKASCPGHVIDHIKALVCGGADKPFNMQWQTIAAAKAKDRWETKGCRK